MRLAGVACAPMVSGGGGSLLRRQIGAARGGGSAWALARKSPPPAPENGALAMGAEIGVRPDFDSDEGLINPYGRLYLIANQPLRVLMFSYR
jgi:hypothetical protein